jgi:DNA-directed RNA polymerase specialized sigma24 family protein
LALITDSTRSTPTRASRRSCAALACPYELLARNLELRFFGGLSVEETAEVLRVSPETVKRDWKLAKVQLLQRLREQKRHDA